MRILLHNPKALGIKTLRSPVLRGLLEGVFNVLGELFPLRRSARSYRQTEDLRKRHLCPATGVYRSLPPRLTPPFEFSPKLGRYELTDEQYNCFRPLLSGKPLGPGRNADDNRRFPNAVDWIARTGALWADLPERFGKQDTVYRRPGHWAKKGRWQAIFETLREPDLDWIVLNSLVQTGLPARCRQKGVPDAEAPGQSQGGFPAFSMSSSTRSEIR